ncbi:MAG: hypothetical protein ABI132_11355 [Rhodanobacteraceae bacterium]
MGSAVNTSITVSPQPTGRHNGIIIYVAGAALVLAAWGQVQKPIIRTLPQSAPFVRPDHMQHDDLQVGVRAQTPGEIAGWISGLVEQLGTSRAGLAGMLGVSRQTLYLWANGGDIRDRNAERLQALRHAAQLLRAAKNPLPAFWQHRVLPGFGVAFSQGMQSGLEPVSMATELVGLWREDTNDAATIDALFARRG